MRSIVIRGARVSALLCMAAVAACASHTAKHAAPPPTSGTIAQNVLTATASVENVDLKTRRVTLKTPEGKTLVVRAGEEVRNLAQVKKGDEVLVHYRQALTYRLLAPGEAAPDEAVAVGTKRAAPGQKPYASGVASVTVVATVVSIDRSTNQVVLRGPDGEEVKTHVRDPRRLEAAKVGDRVALTYSEGIAVSVEKAPPH